MKLTENTKVRVKVPKHLYEAIQAELDKKHEMEEGEEMKEYVGMSPDQAQVAEILGTLIASGGLAVGIKTALQMALDKIKSKKSGGEEKGDINEYVGMSPDQMQVAEILGSLIAAGGLGAAVKTALQMALDKIKSNLVFLWKIKSFVINLITFLSVIIKFGKKGQKKASKGFSKYL